VPECVGAQHFLYKTAPAAFEKGDIDAVVSFVLDSVAAEGLGCAEIMSYKARGVRESSPAAAAALERMIAEIAGHEIFAGEPTLLACEWASVHVDETFEGSAFLSYVLHTGPVGYVMQAISSRETEGLFVVDTSTRSIRAGEAFVFDPTTPHMAVPERPCDGQMLILLQVELADRDWAARQRLLRVLSPTPDSEMRLG
jgi:hypothetical protein